MPSPTVFTIKNINLERFLASGVLETISEYGKHSHGKECYIIANLDSDMVNVDIPSIVENTTKKTFNKNYYVVLCLTGSKTKIRTIENSGQGIYLKVEDDFCLPSNLKIQGQCSIHLVGNSGDNKLQGGGADVRLYGGDGDDTLSGDANDNVLKGGAGSDWLKGNAGDDELCGGADNDELNGGEGDDTLKGGTGNDRLYGNANNDVLKGGAGNDWLEGGIGKDKLYGGTGNDRLYGDAGNDELSGGAGNDVLGGGKGDNVYNFRDHLVFSRIGHDIVQLDSGSKGIDTINFEGNKQYFITKWDSKKQEAKFYLFDKTSKDRAIRTYNGKNHITVKGFSKIRKLLIKNGDSSSKVALAVHKVTYKAKGQEYDFQMLLPEGTKEIFLPTNCKLVSLYHMPDNRFIDIDGVIQKTFTDKTGMLNAALFGVK